MSRRGAKRQNQEGGVSGDSNVVMPLNELEQDRKKKRCRYDTTKSRGDITPAASGEFTAAQVFLPLWQECFRRLSFQPEIKQTSPLLKGTNGDDDGDLLKHLVVERKRELNRLSQRQWRARRKQRKLVRQRSGRTSSDAAAAESKTDDEDVTRSEPNRLKVGVDGINTRSVGDSNGAEPHQTRAFSRARSRASNTKEDVFDNELTSDERVECMTRLQRALGAEQLDECVCTVCDRLVLRHKTCRKDDSDWRYMLEMKKCLKVSNKTLCDDLINQYRSPPHLYALEGVMVSPRGIHCYTDGMNTPRAWFSVCLECDKSIRLGKLPKFSIANGFFVGRLEKQLRGLTLPERFMTQLVSIVALTRVMRGGRHRCIRSHCIAFDCTPGPPILLLPRSATDVVSFQVVMVGEFTPKQSSKIRKMHRIRNQKVREVIQFYKEKNHLYSKVATNESVLNSEGLKNSIEQYLVEHVQDDSGEINDAISKEQQNIRGESDAWCVMSEKEESTVIERRMGLLDSTAPVLANEHPATAQVRDPRESKFEIRRSDTISNDSSGDLFVRMFPHLFPFGHGHPGENREVPVSVLEWVKYYTLLSDRQFAQDELFLLIAFDRISLRNMYIQNHFRCQRFPSILDGYDTLTSDQLGRALLENEQRRQGRLPWRPQGDDVAQRFLKTVEIGTKSHWGSGSERSQCRHQAFAYQTRFGQPALFVTLTPNTDDSLTLAHYAGTLSVETLFDVLEARLPGKAELREASLGNDCASTRLFMRQVDAFIKYALGIDPATRKKMPFRGLFGDVKAYFGMVETQGRGTLHIHLLIWLNNCPPNSIAVERVLNGPKGNTFREQVVSYARTIVTNDLPISIEESGCSKCGAPFSCLSELAIPDSSRRDPIAKKSGTHARVKAIEPALMKCSVCDFQFSSQHFLRYALLRSRPDMWPIWERVLVANEVNEQAKEEFRCRDTIKEAVDIIDNREICRFSLRGSNEYGGGVSELLHQHNNSRMALCKSDDDPFRNDELTRLFLISPPSLSDGRIPRSQVDYMVSALAVHLNQHLWNHTNSCFKQSRATANDLYCRYRFPRDRVENTTFETGGVQLSRKLGHEYINGFNYDIMATFRCNHDIQVLLGGKDVVDRIHYCCKYVTKQQKQLDSQVAVAVAALKRRQDRENTEISTFGAQDSHVVARKRVAALMYNMTNRQEMAGPLAALYLYRGSCCYSSNLCGTLPLGDVVRQLTSADEYCCTLIRETEDRQDSKYHVVSFLDDYIYRPSILQSVNLYEFSMRYFKKKVGSSTRSKLFFLSEHPLHETHVLGERYEEVVPVIQGFRMPSVDSEASSELACKRAVLSLVLFKPFRTLEDIIGVSDFENSEAWLATYEVWKGTRSKFVETIMDNMEDYYRGLHKAESQHRAAAETANCRNSESGTDNSASDGGVFQDEGPCDFAEYQSSDEHEHYTCMWDETGDDDIVLESTSLDPAACPTSVAPGGEVAGIIKNFEKHRILQGISESLGGSARPLWRTEDFPPVELMKKWVRDGKTDNPVISQVSSTVNMRDTQVIELLDDALLGCNMEWKRVMSLIRSPLLTKQFACVRDVSEAFSLNERQYYAIKAIAKALISRWRQAEDFILQDSSFETALRDGQLLLFLGGEGGTGKSRVIDAVQALCESWGRSHCIVKTAMTGKAATIISGRTLASFLLQIRKRRASDTLVNLELLIVDEVSMMMKYQLAQLDIRLRAVKRVPGVVFGGVHIILVGDFLQLPPVGGTPLYQDPAQRRKQASANEIAGYQLWRLFKDVIILKESVRFHKDPEWGRGCQQARRGVWTSEFVRIINSRVMTYGDAMNNSIASRKVGTFVTPDNMTRVAINNLFIRMTAQYLPEGEYPVRVVANFKGKLRKLSGSEVTMIMGLPDTKFGRMAPYLDLIVGMPIQVSQNVRAEKMVANGTIGHLEAILYHPDTDFRLVHDSVADITVKVPSMPPPAVLVRIDRGSSAIAMHGCPHANLFPLFFESQAYGPCDIALPGSVGGVPRSLSLRIQQFPFVCAVSSTAYKVQGETLDSMVVTEWRSKKAAANKREQPYLLVSRVTTREAFVTLQPLTDDIMSWAHPSQAALDEEDRLELLSCETIQRLQQPSDR